MNESFFKFLTWGFVILIFFAVFSPSCSRKSDNYNVDVQTMVSAADGLDLQAVGDLLKKAESAERLEQMLNDTKVGINNLDLDEDGNVDYIRVDEYADGQIKGFSLTVQTASNETQEIATIEIEKSGEYADVQVQGNQHVYGHNHYYHSRFGVTDFLLLSYLMRPHSYYYSPWRWGYYPSYYRSYPVMTTRVYRDRVRSYSRSTPMTRTNSRTLSSTAKSPNAGKSASNIKAPLKNPTTSQKSFQKRNPSKTLKSGGFGKSRTSSSRPSVRSSSRSGGSRRGK